MGGLHLIILMIEKRCDKCHTDLYSYSELPENVKEYDRVTVRAVLRAIKNIEGKDNV